MLVSQFYGSLASSIMVAKTLHDFGNENYVNILRFCGTISV